MNAFSKITATLVASAALFLTFSCSSGGGGGGESPEDGISSSDGNILSSSSVGVSSSSEVPSSSSGVAVVKATLIAEIATAETAKESAEVSADGSDVNPADFWVTSAEMTALTTAITTAETVKNNESATQAEVDNAKTTLQTAITTFNAAKKAGTQASAEAKTALGTKITEATTAKTGVSVSTNGEDIEPSKYWATQSAITTLEAAIATAQTVKDKANATQTEVETATSTLNTAITAFTKQLGVETTTAKAALTAKIEAANSAKADVETASNGASLFTDEFWVTSAQMTAITTAISNAQTVNGKATATKAEVEAVTAALNTAISTFNDVKQPGTVPLCGGDKYNLATEKCCGNDKYTTATYYCSNNAIKEYGWLTDSRGSGQTYKTIEIGTQVWMAENLNYNADGSWCYGDNTGGDSQNNCGTYGRLYDWATAMDGAATSTANPSGVQGVCPNGWHLPSGMEWQILMNFVDGTSLTYPANSNTAGKKLKATSGWSSNGNGTDDFGFAALPGGFGYSDGYFGNVGYSGDWWSATEDSAINAYYRDMYYVSEDAYWYFSNKASLFSVRCVKD